MRKIILKFVVLFMALVPFVNLSGVSAQEITDVKVAEFRGFNWFVVYVADGLGYFEDEGINVEFVLYNDGPVAFQGMHVGDSHFTLMSQEPVLRAHTEGLDSKFIYSVLDTRMYGFGTRPEIEDVQDLKGQSIFAGMPGSSPYSFVSAILAENGLDPEKDVTFVNMNYGSSMAALETNQIQASYFNTDNRIEMGNMDMDVNVIADTLEPEDAQKYLGSEDFPGEIIVATTEFVENNPETVQAFVNAVSRAMDWIHETENEEIAEVLQPYYDGATIENLSERIEITRAGLTETGFISEEGQEAVINFNIGTGVIEEPIPYDAMVDMTFVEEYQNNR